MAFLVQSDLGDVENATAYITEAELRDYWADRGAPLLAWSSSDCEAAIIQATQYIDLRFLYVGTKMAGTTQATEFPRAYSEGIPVNLKKACCEYAYWSQILPLQTVASASEGNIKSERKRIEGAMEKEIVYNGTKSFSQFNQYPVADGLLRSLGVSLSGGCFRA